MKKILLLTLCLIYCSGAGAQQSKKAFDSTIARHPVIFGIRGGVNFNGFGPDVAKVWDTPLKTKSSTGWNLGVVVGCPILESFYFQPGIFYKTKGFKLTDSQPAYNRKIQGRAQYLEFPLLFSYRYNVKRGLQFEFNAGPYIGVGLSGSVTDYKYEDLDDTTPQGPAGINPGYTGGKEPAITVREFFGDDLDDSFGIRKSDIGISLGIGMTVNRFYIGFQYDLGLANLRNEVCWGKQVRFRNRSATILLGFNLQRY